MYLEQVKEIIKDYNILATEIQIVSHKYKTVAIADALLINKFSNEILLIDHKTSSSNPYTIYTTMKQINNAIEPDTTTEERMLVPFDKFTSTSISYWTI